MRKGALELVDEGGVGTQALHEVLGLGAPVSAAVLLTRAAEALDAVHRGHLLEAGKDEIDGLEKEGDGGDDLILGVVHEDSVAEAILFTKVGVEADLDFGDNLEVALDNDGCEGLLVIQIDTVNDAAAVGR